MIYCQYIELENSIYFINNKKDNIMITKEYTIVTDPEAYGMIHAYGILFDDEEAVEEYEEQHEIEREEDY